MSPSRSVRSDRESETLTVAHLAQFERPKTWPEILSLGPRLSASRWRRAILAADEYGSALLTWLPGERRSGRLVPGERQRSGAWTLTEKGRAHVARELAQQTPKPEASSCPES